MPTTCPHCHSENITRSVRLRSVSTETSIRLRYEAEGSFFVSTEYEALKADLCKECGTLVRIFVENPKLNFVKE